MSDAKATIAARTWSPSSWRSLESLQMASYEAADAPEKIFDKLSKLPPLVQSTEVDALKELLAAAKVETAESPEVQAQMHNMRVERSKNEKMKKMLSGLNFGGSSVQMFNPGSGGGLGGLFGGGGGNLTAPAQTDDQMRQLARAIAGASKQAGAAE